jgi:isoamylase
MDGEAHELRSTEGTPAPLGAVARDGGVNFAVHASSAERVEVCLFDSTRREFARIPLRGPTNGVFHAFVQGVGAGLRYGFRVDGPWRPHEGLRFNPNRLLVDPYARSFEGKPRWETNFSPHWREDPRRRADNDTADFAPLSQVLGTEPFDWRGSQRPKVPWEDTVLYEAHVRGFSMRNPGVPTELRGSYLGMAHDASIEHLQSLGITSVELLPVHEFISEEFLAQRNLSNYWGYSTLGFFAPEQRYAARPGCQVEEFKTMVRRLHEANIEVILDVVFNHTAEGSAAGGAMLGLRGLEPASYELAGEHDADVTGCGNSLAAHRLPTLKLVMDSLRYWAADMQVDGFRFDLATTLARNARREFDRESPFLAAVTQDPTLADLKLIAEPWDLGAHGYQLGGFPAPFAEWNDRFRSTTRRFWRGDGGTLPDLARRITGSADLFAASGRPPSASINFVTCHDGFTLNDLVSHGSKKNAANQEGNRDGSDNNDSNLIGADGPTDDPTLQHARALRSRNLLTTLLLSAGTPMILAGDEMGQTQHGNNNAYCQDNELAWLNWDLDESARAQLTFTRSLLRARAACPELRRTRFATPSDLRWFDPDGRELSPHDWAMDRRVICLAFADSLFIIINGSQRDWRVEIPGCTPWRLTLETAATYEHQRSNITVPAQSIAMLRTDHSSSPPRPTGQ